MRRLPKGASPVNTGDQQGKIVALLVSAALGPHAGRAIDRWGGRFVLAGTNLVFAAGFLPGFLVMALYSGYIVVWSLLNPAKQPPPVTST